jgi:hypothetical protein
VTPTFVEFTFGQNAFNVAFDFAVAMGTVRAVAYDDSDTEVFDGFFSGTDSFFTSTAAQLGSGTATLGGIGPVRRVRIEVENQGLIVDNLRFEFGADPEPVPEPAAVFLLASGLAALSAWPAFRRKFRM